MEGNSVKADKLKKVYRLLAEEITALKEVDFEVTRGEFVTVMGPSGAGKTTLLNLIGCLDVPSAGRLNILGRDLSGRKEKDLISIRRSNIGFVFQEFFLIPSLTALENVELALYFSRAKKEKNAPAELLERIGLGRRLNHLPGELSGGEMQRVAIARALITSPAILLADEPTGNLDTENAKGIFELFRQFNEDEKITIIVATHNIQLGYQANRVIHLQDGNIIKDERTT